MAESSLFWGGTTVGDCGPYNDDQFSDFMKYAFIQDNTMQGIFFRRFNELAVTVVGSNALIDTGCALVDGKLYLNTASTSLALSAPVADWNHYTIVIRKNFAAQTVRADFEGPVNGPFSVALFPDPVQIDGVTWDLPLAAVAIHSSGASLVYPYRRYVGDSSLSITNRVGGDAEEWVTAGSTAYEVNSSRAQIGSVVSGVTGVTHVSFPVPYNEIPMAFTNINPSTGTGISQAVCTQTGMDIYTKTLAGVALSGVTVHWMIVGPQRESLY